ncbi:MAG: hypothetical protein ICV64_03400 [Thermoleophilia bacterium]|nr:hypothetical protein [Thermoleophilia bacterium]
MSPLAVECLRCGQPHVLGDARWERLTESECPRCGYLGWAPSAALDEPARRALRERPVEERRLRVA